MCEWYSSAIKYCAQLGVWVVCWLCFCVVHIEMLQFCIADDMCTSMISLVVMKLVNCSSKAILMHTKDSEKEWILGTFLPLRFLAITGPGSCSTYILCVYCVFEVLELSVITRFLFLLCVYVCKGGGGQGGIKSGYPNNSANCIPFFSFFFYVIWRFQTRRQAKYKIPLNMAF